MNLFLADTCVWIDYYSGKIPGLEDWMNDAILENRLYINGVIRTEILHGARDETRFRTLADALDGIRWDDMDKTIFEKAAFLAFEAKRNGLILNLSDTLIAAHCYVRGWSLMSRDRHFQEIQRFLPLKLCYYDSEGVKT